MKRFVLAVLLTCGVTVSVVIGAMLTAAQLPGALLIGAVVGALLIVLAVAGHRLNARMTAAVVAAYKPTGRATGHSDTLAAIGARVAAPSGARGNVGAADDWHSFAFSAPHVQRGTTTVRRYRQLRLGDGTAAAGPLEIENRTPHRTPSTTADVTVPVMQAAITAAIAALVVGGLALVAGRGDVLRLAGGAFVLTLAAAWLWRLGVVDSLLQTIETVTQRDIDGDGQIGKPDDGHVLVENAGRAREAVAAAADETSRRASTAAMLAFWQKCVQIGTATRDHGARPGTKALEDYEAARDVLFSLGLAKWRNEANHRAGWDVTTDLETGAKIIGQHVKTMRQARHNS